MTEGRKPASISRPVRTPGSTLGSRLSSTEHSTNHSVNINTVTKEMTVKPIMEPIKVLPKPIRILPKPIKVLLYAITGMIMIPLMLAIIVGTIKGIAEGGSSPAGSSTATSQVANFNDGFSTAKEDDCEQGFEPACKWLQENH